MAKTVISGLTVTIGANTKEFENKIKEIDRVSKNVAKDLKTVSESMKLDPKAIQTYTDKIKLLQEAINNSKNKIDLAEKAIEALNKDFAEKKVSPEDYAKSLSALKRQLESAEYEYERNISALRNYTKELRSSAESENEAKKSNNNLSDSVEKAGKSYLMFYEKTSKAEGMLEEYGKEADNAGKKTLSLGDIIKGNLISAGIQKGLSIIANFAKTIAHYFGQAAKAVWNFSKESVDMAAEYQDALGYSEKVFGGQAGNMTDWIKDNSVALRIGMKDLQVFANDFGTAFSALGLTNSKAVDFTENILSLSADIRAATGKDIEEINSALARGFTSSLRNFRQFGLYLSEADIKIQAIKDGTIEYAGDQEELAKAMKKAASAAAEFERAMDLYEEGTDEYTAAEEAANLATEELNALLGEQEVTLTSSERAQSLYNLVMERFSFLIGQNTEEAGLYHSQMNALKTTFSNIQLEIGQRLLPVFTDLVTRINNFTQTQEFEDLLNTIYDTIENISKSVMDFIESGRMQDFINWLTTNLPTLGTKIEEIGNKLADIITKAWDIVDAVGHAWDVVANRGGEDIDSHIASGRMYGSNGSGWIFGKASGGPVSAGQMYRVNDDAGHRVEAFIPAQNGYILNGNQTDKIVNNNNSHNFSGGINIYIGEYSGSDVNAFAEKLGVLVNQRLRQSGAML